MKTIIAGSRKGIEYKDVLEAVAHSGIDVTEVVSGGAIGVDTMGEKWANENSIRIRRFLPDWEEGLAAGIIRNKQMADYAAALIAVWDGESRGTKNMIEEATKRDLRVYVHFTTESLFTL